MILAHEPERSSIKRFGHLIQRKRTDIELKGNVNINSFTHVNCFAEKDINTHKQRKLFCVLHKGLESEEQ